MQIIFQSLVILFFMSIGCIGFHRMWMYATQQGQIFGVVDSWAASLMRKADKSKNPFLYTLIHKSLGSCPFCNRQRFIDLQFILFIMITYQEMVWYHYFFYFIPCVGIVVSIDTWFGVMQSKYPKNKRSSLKKTTTTL